MTATDNDDFEEKEDLEYEVHDFRQEVEALNLENDALREEIYELKDLMQSAINKLTVIEDE